MAETTQEVIISMPLYVQLSKKEKAKKYHINLNVYNQWHYIAKNNIKVKYKEIASPKLEGLVFDKKIELTFTLWKATKRKVDRANPLSIHEKFFCDALTELGCIPDDNDDHVYATHYYTGGLDRENPRVDITIKEVYE